MPGGTLVLGIDVGTTGVRVIAVDQTGHVVKQAHKALPFDVLPGGGTEQDPRDWWEAAVTCLREITGELGTHQVQALGLTGQMHGSVFLDRQGRVIRPAILWNDQRTTMECRWLEDELGDPWIYAQTGNFPQTGYTLPKVLWLQNHEPDNYARLAHLLLPKDYVALRLTGRYATDASDASGTLLFDLWKEQWSEGICARTRIDPSWLPPIHRSSDVIGGVTAEAAAATGLEVGIPVVAGGGDQAAAAMAGGVVDAGTGLLSLGTSGVVFVPLAAAPQRETDVLSNEAKTIQQFRHMPAGTWHMMGVMLNCGASLRWLKGALFPDSSYAAMDQMAAAVEAASGGLFFLPYLNGERAPHADPNARGAFVGLGLQHTSAHLIRAVLEGIAFALQDIAQLLESHGGRMNRVRVTGGGAESRLWRTLIASALGCTLQSVGTNEGPAMGAAVAAAVGGGWYGDFGEATEAMVHLGECIAPDAALQEACQQGFATYRQLYRQLEPIFRQIGAQNMAAVRQG